MKTIKHLLLSLLILSAWSSFGQDEAYLNNDKIREELSNSSGITAEQLCRSTWVIEKSIAQFIFDNPEDNMIYDMNFNGYTYTFFPNGTYQVEAIIDSDGKWELQNNGKTLYLYNNLRKDEEFHQVTIEGSTMKWYIFEGASLIYLFLNRE